MSDVIELLRAAVGAEVVAAGDGAADDYGHDEALEATPVTPVAVLRPRTTDEVAAILRCCTEHGIAVTARGSGSGLSGACIPVAGGVVVSFERMNRILEIDSLGGVAVVQPGVTLEQLDTELAPLGVAYPVRPGEYSASLGGNVNTNAGGMQAVKHGVTRHHVLGLEIVLATGEVMRTGGRTVKSSSGYDLTQLVIGSEGTLALVTEVTLKLVPRLPRAATVLVPFRTLDEVSSAVPKVIAAGLTPTILEYIDLLTMAAIRDRFGVDPGIPDEVKATALAYLLVQLESTTDDRLDDDVAGLGELLVGLGAIDVYVLPAGSAAQLVEAREKAFWLAKANGANDIVDVCVPRGAMPAYMEAVRLIGERTASWIAGCGHAGDGNVHLAVFQGDPVARKEVVRDLLRAGLELGGAMSGEHGIGVTKKPYFVELENPVKLALLRRIKLAFDPAGILNPGTIFDLEATS
ncbi:MAG: FAD-linked oxidase C-terminal domain-containing protein [Acidimicrobiales bacterium]